VEKIRWSDERRALWGEEWGWYDAMCSNEGKHRIFSEIGK